MCNLYAMGATQQEVAAYFKATEDWRREVMTPPANFAAEVYPGYSGLVLAGDELRAMVWGFPKALLSKKTGLPLKPMPVNNARSENLLNPKGMWRDSFEERRCLIPLTAFAEAEGEKGAMTRTWFALPEQPIFAVAGIWRDTDEWGPAYSMVMTNACIHVAGIHDRMPVILAPGDYATWVDGPADEARALCVPWGGEMTVERTAQRWSGGS